VTFVGTRETALEKGMGGDYRGGKKRSRQGKRDLLFTGGSVGEIDDDQEKSSDERTDRRRILRQDPSGGYGSRPGLERTL